MNISSLIAIFAVLYLALTAVVYVSQRSLLYHPDKALHSPRQYGAGNMEEMRTNSGETLVHWYAKGRFDTSAVVVLFQGNAGHVGYRVFKAKILMARGYGVLLVGYRGYGANGGSPTEEGLYEDARSALNALLDRGISKKQIVLYGESLGTGVAVQMATEGYGNALILEASYSSITDVAFHHYPIFPVGLLLKDRFDSESKIGKITVPKLFLHGQKDQIIPIKFGDRLYKKASDPKVWKRFEAAGHNDLYEQGAEHAVLEFLSTYFPE